MTKSKSKTSDNGRGNGAPQGDPTSAGGYTVLARRYRSRDFDELIGQEPIARTLRNAIETGRTAHAYLFCGTRGVGKTSMARIFARALNVHDALAEKDQIAEAIFRGDDLDVIEIDGASNRGIADAKDLIAGAGLSPARCKYKIYIIDEVHALTKDAFNALLKTMEEPPAHVKFILCTTEASKVPPTIQSRCQRFDFRPISVARITEQLRMILKAEGIEAEDAVISRVAQLGNGSMRDALSLLDRLLAASGNTLTVELLEQMVGLPDQSLITSLVDAVIEGDAGEALKRGDTLLRQGTTIEQAFELLSEHYRNLMIVTACGADSEMLELAGDGRDAAVRQADHFDTAGLVHLIALCDAIGRNARHSTAGRALFDAALVRMCMSGHFASIVEVLRGNASSGGDATAMPAPGKKKVSPERERESLAATAEQPPQSLVTEVKPSPAQTPMTAEDVWQRVLEHARGSNMAQAKLEGLSVESLQGTTLHLSINEHGAASARVLSSDGSWLADLVHKATGRKLDVKIETADTGVGNSHVPSDLLNVAASLPLVRQAMELFDARITSVEQRH